MLRSTTSCLELGTTIGATGISTTTCLDEEGNVKKTGVISSAIVSATSTTSTSLQNIHERKALSNAYAYIESLSDEQIAEMLEKLDQKENTLLATNEKENSIEKTKRKA